MLEMLLNVKVSIHRILRTDLTVLCSIVYKIIIRIVIHKGVGCHLTRFRKLIYCLVKARGGLGKSFKKSKKYYFLNQFIFYDGNFAATYLFVAA